MSERGARLVITALSLVVIGAVVVATSGHHGPGAGSAVASSRLPALNASLNATSALLLTIGFVMIRRRRVAAHRAAMLAALVSSTAFLVSYLVYHSQVGSVPFSGTGWVRWVYFPILVTHIVLAAVIVPLALTTVYRALSGQFARHRRIARWTLPLWLYVSVSGVVVYLMVHHG